MITEPLKLCKRGEYGSKVISVRIREDVLSELDRISAEVNYSQNELINLIFAHDVKSIEIE